MIPHLNAIKSDLSPLGYTTHLIWANVVTAQYLVLSAKSWERPDEMPVCGATDALDTDVRIKAVTGTPDGVAIMLNRIRVRMSPQLLPRRVPMDGRAVWLQFVRSEFIDVDQDVTITGTNRHPAVGVDTYRMLSEPN